MTEDRRDDEPAPPDVDDEDPAEAPTWAQATTEMKPEEPEAPEHASRETAELSQAALLDIAEAVPVEEPVEDQLSVEQVALEAEAADAAAAAAPWDPDEPTGEMAAQSAKPKPVPPPVPADADEHPGPPPTLDVPDGILQGHQWQSERRSLRRPQSKLSAEAINKAIRVADVDSRPLQHRPQPGEVDPWQTVTPGAGLEGQIAMEVLGQVRRGTQGVTAVDSGARFGPLWWLGAAAVVGLMAYAAVALWRTQTAADEIVAENPVEAVEPGPEGGEDPAEGLVDRRDLRNAVFEAFREGDYVRALAIGERLETEFHVDWEAEFTLAEAARLSRHFEDAVARYSEFIQKYPKNVRNDDAHFWMAEAMRLQGNLKGARRHYRAVVDNRRSNMRSLAKKRLAQLK